MFQNLGEGKAVVMKKNRIGCGLAVALLMAMMVAQAADATDIPLWGKEAAIWVEGGREFYVGPEGGRTQLFRPEDDNTEGIL